MHLHDGAGICEECEPERYAAAVGDGSGLAPGQAARIAEAILAEPDTSGIHEDDRGVVKTGQRRNRHLDGDGYGQGR